MKPKDQTDRKIGAQPENMFFTSKLKVVPYNLFYA